MIGGQDELVFAGGSLALAANGEIIAQGQYFEEQTLTVQLDNNQQLIASKVAQSPIPSEEALIYNALVLATRDYIEKNHFSGAVLGLSGGIDSALPLAIAVDAIGAKHVQAVMMPSRYTADMSQDDAAAEAETLGVHYSVLAIEKPFTAFLETLSGEFAGLETDTTEENIQARCRGILLMAISNKTGKLVLTTGNKSEMSVGYATLYGDMAGGFAVLKDVPKTLVFRLAHYRNTISPVIPQRVIDRPPSAELGPEQIDEDSLPPYSILDAILERFVERDQSIIEIVAAGFEQETVEKIVAMVKRNEYKRRQAAPGPRVTPRAYGRDRRYPITSGF
jgi:NAD+ synthase (glutamine-hydrolysing)